MRQRAIACGQSAEKKYLLAPLQRLNVKQPASSAKVNLFAMAKKPQIQKFREAARAHECDEGQERFDEGLEAGGEKAA
jgi:hypothetical protein